LPGDKEEEEEDEALKDILLLAGDLLDSDDLVDSIMKEGDAGCNVNDDVNPDHNLLELEEDSLTQVQVAAQQQRDELTDIFRRRSKLAAYPTWTARMSEDIFKGVLTRVARIPIGRLFTNDTGSTAAATTFHGCWFQFEQKQCDCMRNQSWNFDASSSRSVAQQL
jgi:hypothetical protein